MKLEGATKELFLSGRARHRLITAAAGVALVLGLSGARAGAEWASDATELTDTKIVSAERDVLQRTFEMLSQGDHDYHGHRLRAKKRIRAAGLLLSMNLEGEGDGTEPQKESDGSLQLAQDMLKELRTKLPADESPKMLDNLDNAIKQIGAALAVEQNEDEEAGDAANGDGSRSPPKGNKSASGPGSFQAGEPAQTVASSEPDTTGTSGPLVVELTSQGGSVNLTWNAVPGQRYQVLYSSSFSGGDWHNLGEVVTAGSNSVSVSVPATDDAQRFYRVALVP
jgi:hypothetical protein